MVGAFVANFMGSELKDDPIYQERLAQGLIKLAGTQKRENRDLHLPHRDHSGGVLRGGDFKLDWSNRKPSAWP